MMKKFKALLEKILFSDNYLEEKTETEEVNDKKGKHSN